MNRQLLLILAAATLLADAHAESLGARVVDEAGRAIAEARVQIDGVAVSVDDAGRFEIPGAAPLVQVHVTADGYYGFIHTLARTDGAVSDIMLVERKPERRLLMFAGDTMLARRYFEPREGEPVLVRRDHVVADGAALLSHVAPYVGLADFASLNLETQLADEDPAERLPKSVTFYSPTALAGLVRDAGFDYVALGNNHTFDYRDAGLATTLNAINAAGLAWSGAGHTEAEARRPYFGETEGHPLAYLSYVGWAGGFEPNQVAGPDKGGAAYGDATIFTTDLAQVPSGRTAVLQYHSGLEYVEAPPLRERTALQGAIEAGADLAIGHHSHVIQGFEIHDGKLINFSLGNFLFDQYHYTTQLGMLLYVWMDGEDFHRAEIVPLHINGYVPTPATGAVRYAVLNRLARLSEPYGVCLRASGVHAVISADNASASCQPRVLDAPKHGGSVALAQLGGSPLQPLVATHGRYRVGVDILQRGDFSYVGLFGTRDRSWIENDNVEIVGTENPALRVTVRPDAAPVQAGMRVFERVFRRSNPATVSGRVLADGDIELRVLMQRRGSDESLGDALEAGALTEIGRIRPTGMGWQPFAFDHDLPRVATRAVRLLFEVHATGDTAATVLLDDLAWVEWHTPWLVSGDGGPVFGSHVAFRPSKPTE